MTFKKYILFTLTLLCVLGASAANKPQTVYMFGFAASFNDSTVYFTEIQQVDSACIDSKTKFLYSRENYSYQLRDYLATQDFPNATCVTSFALKRKDVEKKYMRLRKKYIESGKYNVKYLPRAQFMFEAIKEQ